MKRLLIPVVLVGVLFSCDQKKQVALQQEVDSLRAALTLNRQMATTLQEVGLLIDSIDTNRDALRANMTEGLPYEDYVGRMQDINEFVRASYSKIDDLEKALRKNKGSSASLANTIKKLKKDLEERTRALNELSTQIARYKSENDSLVNTVSVQSTDISDKTQQLTTMKEDVANMERRIQEMLDQSKIEQAEAYFLRAQALEEAARRTKLAPKKKKNTKREALELYKLAASGGKAEAGEKVAQLEKEI